VYGWVGGLVGVCSVCVLLKFCSWRSKASSSLFSYYSLEMAVDASLPKNVDEVVGGNPLVLEAIVGGLSLILYDIQKCRS